MGRARGKREEGRAPRLITLMNIPHSWHLSSPPKNPMPPNARLHSSPAVPPSNKHSRVSYSSI